MKNKHGHLDTEARGYAFWVHTAILSQKGAKKSSM